MHKYFNRGKMNGATDTSRISPSLIALNSIYNIGSFSILTSLP